jgi:hypothetical protein
MADGANSLTVGASAGPSAGPPMWTMPATRMGVVFSLANLAA